MPFSLLFFLSFILGSLVKLTDDIEDKNLDIHSLYAIPGGLTKTGSKGQESSRLQSWR